MSYISDYRCGALSYEDYRIERARINREDAYDFEDDMDFDEEDDEYDEES